MPLPSSLAIPVSTRICLNPPPAATMSKMPAIGGSAAPTLLLIASRFMPEALLRVKIASRVVSSKANIGSPRKSKILWTAVPLRAKISARALPIMRTTGSRTVIKVTENLGRPGAIPQRPFSSELRKRSGASAGTHRAASRENSGPAATTVGMAIRTPSPRVMPRSALSSPMAANGPG